MKSVRHLLFFALLLAPGLMPCRSLAQANEYASDGFATVLLSQSPFLYDRMISPFHTPVFRPVPAGSMRFGQNPLSNLFLRQPDVPAIDTNKGVSVLNVILGSKREQLLYLDHHQKLGKHMDAVFNYSSIVSPGFLLNALARHQRVDLNVSGKWKLYKVGLKAEYQNSSMDENGGVDSGIVSEGLDFSAYEQLPTQLSDDRRKMRYLSLMQHNSFQLACRADSSGSNTIELVLDLSLDRFGSSYTGSADSLFYADAFQDRSATFDTSSYLLLGVKPALDFSWKWVQTKMGLTLGMDWQQADVRVDTLEERGLYSIGRVHWYAERPHWKAALNARSVSGSWLNEGDYSLDGSLDWTTGSKTISNVRLEGGTFRLMPEYTMSRYHSNHFVWENDFAAEEIKSAKASLDMLNGALTLYSSYSVSENWVYADSNARPAQSMESLSLLSSGMKVVQKGKHWKVELALMYQKPDDERVRVPEWSGKIRIARRDEWFRHALKAEYGFSLYGVRDYTGLAYMPATGLLYLQSTERMGGQPVADFFFHAGMGRATLTLMVQRFNDGWWGGENRLAAGYPVPPRTIKFGLRWLLLN